MATAVGFAIAVAAFSCVWDMPNVAPAEVTVMGDEAVTPTALATMLPDAAAVPVTVTVSCPLASVLPDDGVSVTPAGLVKVTGAPKIGLFPASLAVSVMVIDVEPLSGTDEPLALAVSVEPTICTGSCAVADPAAAVIVAVRLALYKAVPAEKVKVAVPAGPVLTVLEFNMPVSELKLTTTSGVAAFPELRAVTVMVVVLELSDLTVVGEAERESAAAVAVAPTPLVAPVPVVAPTPGPQPVSIASIAANKNQTEKFEIFCLH